MAMIPLALNEIIRTIQCHHVPLTLNSVMSDMTKVAHRRALPFERM